MRTGQQSIFAPRLIRFPPDVRFGAGEREKLAAYLKNKGCRTAWILGGQSSRQTIGEQLREMETAGINVATTIGLTAEPTVDDFHAVCREHSAGDMDAIIGIGGGSVLDMVKLLAAIGEQPETLPECFGNDHLSPRQRLLVCLPTTAGAGSEASPNAILLDTADWMKKAVISPHLVPDLSIIDPELALSLPPDVTAATGFDALSHCIEAFANLNAHSLVDGYALQGISLLAQYLLPAVEDGENLEARSALAIGSFLGGLCLGPVNTAAVHALSYPLGSTHRLPHGLANALLLPHVIRFNIPSMPDRYARISEAMGLERLSSSEETAKAGVAHLAELATACGLNMGLAHHGITKEDIPSLADQAIQVTRLLKNNPSPIARGDAISIYHQAL